MKHWVDDLNEQIPDSVRDEVRYDLVIEDHAIILLERRRPHDVDIVGAEIATPVAKLRYTKSRAEWSLLWCDANDDFHRYDEIPPTPHIDGLLDEIERDPTNRFWG